MGKIIASSRRLAALSRCAQLTERLEEARKIKEVSGRRAGYKRDPGNPGLCQLPPCADLALFQISSLRVNVPALKVNDGVLDPSNFTSLLIWLLQGNETLRTFPDALFESAT